MPLDENAHALPHRISVLVEVFVLGRSDVQVCRQCHVDLKDLAHVRPASRASVDHARSKNEPRPSSTAMFQYSLVSFLLIKIRNRQSTGKDLVTLKLSSTPTCHHEKV
jgi:hypothetical protein